MKGRNLLDKSRNYFDSPRNQNVLSPSDFQFEDAEFGESDLEHRIDLVVKMILLKNPDIKNSVMISVSNTSISNAYFLTKEMFVDYMEKTNDDRVDLLIMSVCLSEQLGVDYSRFFSILCHEGCVDIIEYVKKSRGDIFDQFIGKSDVKSISGIDYSWVPQKSTHV